MSGSSTRARTVSYDQVKSIVDFMGQHLDFASGNLRSLEARHNSKRLWGELTKVLHSCRGGTRKTSDGWSKYWSDFKNKLKNKVLKQKNGLRPRALTKLERRVLVILGPHFAKADSKSDDNTDFSNNITIIKQESYHENITSEFSKDFTNDKLSGQDDDNQNSSESSSDEYDGDDHSTGEPVLNGIYPKWLIEVEKQRAETELRRAKAEEQRAMTASKNSDAALIQAEALNRLAEAAGKQADAILRIAAILENRGIYQPSNNILL